jgi:hypothetical protein
MTANGPVGGAHYHTRSAIDNRIACLVYDRDHQHGWACREARRYREHPVATHHL